MTAYLSWRKSIKLISDIMMPQVSGIQFLKQLREDPRFESLPVVFLTAKGMSCDRIEGYQTGCDAYLPKPFNPDELVAIIENLLLRRTIVTKANSNIAAIRDVGREIEKIKEMLRNTGAMGYALGKAMGYAPPLAIAKSPSLIKIDLTPREQSVLDLVAEGLMNKEIARRLDTSVRNVEKFVSKLFIKTGTTSRTELVRYALQNGLTN